LHTPPEIWDSIRVIQLARRLGITKNAVYKWQKKGKIPAERVLEIEALYPDLKPYRLRPDLWPAPESDQIASG
jgi:DNA-binding transcriptional regulator YdaS (Cro superfamily)